MKKGYLVFGAAALTAASFATGYLLAKQKKPADDRCDDENGHIKSLVHDMKGSVAAIVGYAAALSDRVVPEEKLDFAIGVIKSEGERLSGMVEEVLYGDGACVGDMEDVDLLALTREVLILNEEAMTSKGIEPFLISDDTPYVVNADKRAIFRAVANIIENAVKYSDGNTPITVTVERRGKYVSLSVRNIGVGISFRDMNHIFDKYYRSNDSKNKGLGLGLHTTAKIIKAHNGKISVNSKKNEYFEITLTMNLVK